MENVSTRTWVFVGLVGTLLFMSQWLKWIGQYSHKKNSVVSFSYEMPRPTNFEPEFSLSDRLVERENLQLPALPQLKNPALKTGPRQVDSKKAADEKKKLAAQKALAAARKAALAKNKKAEVNVVNTQREMGLSADTTTAAAEVAIAGYAEPVLEKTKEKSDKNSHTQNNQTDDLSLSTSQWRALLQSNPTLENSKKFAKAHDLKKIDSKEYYQIIHELLIDTAEDRRRAAGYILSVDVNAASYEFLIGELATAPADSRILIQKSLDTYAQPNQVQTLVQVMASSKTAAQAAATQLNKEFQAFKQVWTSTQDPTQVRKLSGGHSPQNFANVLGTLKRIANQSGNSVSSQANQLASEIQALQNSRT